MLDARLVRCELRSLVLRVLVHVLQLGGECADLGLLLLIARSISAQLLAQTLHHRFVGDLIVVLLLFQVYNLRLHPHFGAREPCVSVFVRAPKLLDLLLLPHTHLAHARFALSVRIFVVLKCIQELAKLLARGCAAASP